MIGTPAIEIDAARRILRLKKALCAGIITGTDKIRCGYGNGDCLYLDFGSRVFALADATERFPGASRDILMRLSDALNQEVPATAADWKTLINRRVYAGQKYQHKTTFSCLAIRDDEDGLLLTVAHGGDSAVTVMDSASGEVLFQTGRNMVFAGRSTEIVDVVEYRLTDKSARIIISSDGFEDLMRFCISKELLSSLTEVFAAYPVDNWGGLIHRVLERNAGQFEHDDIGFIVMDPFHIAAGRRLILIGGTQPQEEKRYQSTRELRRTEKWVTEGKWIENAAAFSAAGIVIRED
ncbi:MAG: hypothetical protein PHY31_00740 [Smithellaceae bacterium]|nr:hypothetical protein [Smithellaceae bacterium]